MKNIQDKYLWTNHARDKMRYYRLTESRIKRIIRYPTRVEEGVLDDAVACMQPAGGKNYSEIWVMYLVVSGYSDNSFRRHAKISQREIFLKTRPRSFTLGKNHAREASSWSAQGITGITTSSLHLKKLKVITAWRYPGKSPEREPVPSSILKEVRKLIHG